MNKSRREYSSFELLRIFFLLTLISFHWLHFWGDSIDNYIDTRICYALSTMSISGFAMITGFFAFGKKKMVSKNIYRLFYIIIISIILGTTTILALGQSISDNYYNIFSGSRDSWYLYAIIPVYGFCYLSNSVLSKMKWYVPLTVGTTLYSFLFGLSYLSGWSNLPLGYTRNVLLLLSWTLIGLGIRKLTDQKNGKKILNWIFSIFFIIALVIKIILVCHFTRKATGKTTPDTIIISTCLIYFASLKKYNSRDINIMSKYSYFAYEFHWLWQKVYVVLFSSFILKHPHLQFYINWILIGGFSLFISIILSFIQFKVWDRYIVHNSNKFIKIVWEKSKVNY